MSDIVVAEITVVHPHGLDERFQASRIYYPQHPSNAVEFDDATTGQRMLVFGSIIVRHLQANQGPKSPVFTSLSYYGFWLFWLGILVGGIWWATHR